MFEFFGISTYGVGVSDAGELLLIFYVIKKMIWEGQKVKITNPDTLLIVIAMLFISVLSGVFVVFEHNSDITIQFIKTFLHFVYVIIPLIIFIIFPIKLEDWAKLIKALLIISIIINIFGVYQIFARAFGLPLAWLSSNSRNMATRSYGVDNEISQISLQFASFFRNTSVFSEPSALANFNNVILIFLITPLIYSGKFILKNQGLAVLIFIISLISLFLTFSMTGFTGLGIFISFLFIFERFSKTKKMIPVIIISVLIIIFADILVENYLNISVISLFTDRIYGISSGGHASRQMAGESFWLRASGIKIAWECFLNNPLLGHGLGLTFIFTKGKVMFYDSSFLQVLSELGLIGLIIFISMFITPLYYINRLLNSNRKLNFITPENSSLLGIAFFIGCNTFLIQNIAGNQVISQSLYFFFGLSVSILNAILVKYDCHGLIKKQYEFRLVSKPLKILLAENIGFFIHSKVKNNINDE
ncbi:MAG: O-antigen ligase family protein [Candidatus Kapabacteria bacterium]|nr:O-antigen ligase family protein [Candidatus Kapabacteria bacterium]